MTSRSTELLRRGRLLLLSGALAVGSLAAAATSAHAQTPQISIAPASSTSCPVLTFSGQGFTRNSGLEIHLYRNGSYVTSFYPQSDGSGNIAPAVTYNNHFTGAGSWSAYAVDTASHQLAWSNRTAACSR